MQKREINPTEWLQAFNINHGGEVTGRQRVLYLSGQTPRMARRYIPFDPVRTSISEYIS